MNLLAIRRPAVAVMAAVGLALGGAVMATPRAGATETIINDWLDGYHCHTDGGGWACLWYHPGLDGAYWATTSTPDDLDTDGAVFNHTNFSIDTNEAAQGYHRAVNNDAGSMADSTSNCTVDTYYYGNETGNYDHLSPGWAGNLSSGLHNLEGSIAYYC